MDLESRSPARQGCALASERRRRVPSSERKTGAYALPVAVALLAGACVPAAGSGGDEAGESVGVGSTVAVLEARTPGFEPFLLRGTFPVPPNTFPRADGAQPFRVRDTDGTLVDAQTEIVSRYASDARGADVVEVIARVHRDPGAAVGEFRTWDVVLDPHGQVPSPGATATVDDLRQVTSPLPATVDGLLASPTSIVLRAVDCFGNEYAALPLAASGNGRMTRFGRNQAELASHHVMLPTPPVAGPSGTLPHLLGVHSYVRTYAGEEIVGLDLRFHNALSGRDGSTTADDALDKLYFEEIELVVPAGWYVHQDFEDPYFGAPYEEDGRHVQPVVAPLEDGRLHVIRWQGQFHRRLILSRVQSGFHAWEYVTVHSGQAFCTRGNDPQDGHAYWSWWNPSTSRYYPQCHQLPRLDHVGIPQVRQELQEGMDLVREHLENGTNMGSYPIVANAMGWGHPWGVSYGGMTGGAEIHLYDGVDVAAAASPEGYRFYCGLHRMQTDRQPSALYDLDGTPSTVEDWLVRLGGDGDADYVPFSHFLLPDLGSGDPFGVGLTPQFQNVYVQGALLRPTWEGAHMGYDPQDYQHFIRYTRAAKVLAWLGNDPLAKDDLLMQAENFHLSYHPYRNSAYGYVQGNGLRGAREFVDEHWMSGFGFGRGEAWGLDCAVAAYATQTPEWRARKKPWLDQVAQLLNDGQAGCSGFIQAGVSPKFIDGLYRARQSIEQSITENMLRGMIERVYKGADPGRTAMLRSVYEDSLLAFISDMAWWPGENAPWTHTAVGPRQIDLPIWCSYAELPSNGYTPAYETYLDWSSFAYGFEETGSVQFLNKAGQQMGGGDLLTGLENAGLASLQTGAALLALMQRRNGDL